MANERVPTQAGEEIPDDVSILVGGQLFDGWETVSVTETIEAMASEFTIGLFDKFEGLKADWPLKPGAEIKVNIGDLRVLTGRIEQLNPQYDKSSRSYTISGRSRSGDLIDCTHDGPAEYKNISLDKLAEELVKPFGLKVFVSITPTVIEKFAVKPGETIFEALDRAARLQGFLFISTRGGNIRLTKAGATEARFRAFSSIEQGVNIISAGAEYDDSQRFKDYNVIGQAAGKDDFSGLDVTQVKGTAKDAGVTRHRPLTLIAESDVDNAKAEKRAQWEASLRLAKAIRVTVKVQGWVQENGTLWGANQITNFRSKILGLNRDLLITDIVRHDSTNEGKTTDITLVDPQAYSAKPIVNKKKSDDIFADLGSNF